MTRLHRDFMKGELDDAISNVATFIPSVQFQSLPVIAAPDTMVLVLDPLAVHGAPEKVLVTARAAGVGGATVIRGYEGTVPRAHPIPTVWRHGPVATDIGVSSAPAALRQFYAAPWGSNSNDGLSWGSAFLDVKTAYAAAPSEGAHILFADGTYWDAANPTRGMWLDATGGVLDTGFVVAKPFITLEGIPNSTPAQTSTGPKAELKGGNGTNRGIDFKGARNFALKNVRAGALRLSENAVGAFNLSFDNCSFVTPAGSTLRAIDLVGNDNMFWVHWHNVSAINNIGNVGEVILDHDLVYVDRVFEMHWDIGEIFAGRVTVVAPQTVGGGGPSLSKITGEYLGANTKAFVEVHTSNYQTPTVLDRIRVYDSTSPIETVDVINADGVESQVVAIDCGIVRGPALLLGSSTTLSVQFSGGGRLPHANRQMGFFRDQMYGRVAQFERAFAPTFVPAQNRAVTDPATPWPGATGGWYPAGGDATLTTGIADPVGGTFAGRLAWASAGEGRREFSAHYNHVGVVGEIIVACLWARVQSGANSPSFHLRSVSGVGRITPDLIDNTTDNGQLLTNTTVLVRNGEWQLIRLVARVSTAGALELVLYETQPNPSTIDVYAPTLMVLPAAADSVEVAYSVMPTGNDTAAVGTIAVQPYASLYGRMITTLSIASLGAGLRVPHGTAPTSPVDGDFWTTSAGAFIRINGVTKSINLT